MKNQEENLNFLLQIFTVQIGSLLLNLMEEFIATKKYDQQKDLILKEKGLKVLRIKLRT